MLRKENVRAEEALGDATLDIKILKKKLEDGSTRTEMKSFREFGWSMNRDTILAVANPLFNYKQDYPEGKGTAETTVNT